MVCTKDFMSGVSYSNWSLDGGEGVVGDLDLRVEFRYMGIGKGEDT